jgi:hypothetical protein
VCTRGSNRALLRGPSTSPLGASMKPMLFVLAPAASALLGVSILSATDFAYLTRPSPVGYGILSLGTALFGTAVGSATYILGRGRRHAWLPAIVTAAVSCCVFVYLVLLVIVNVRGS